MIKKGSVVLAGAGPGDPELITVKLMRCLQKADVIITDRLVNPVIYQQYANPDAELILVGKQGYNANSCSQEEITALIVTKAQEGKEVLRLKGGDVAFFSNVLDELESLVSNGLPFSIIPGITAASGASAFSGIPLTARGYATAVSFISYNPMVAYEDSFWASLSVKSDETKVLYMASKNLATFVGKCISNGADGRTPIAIIEQATTLYHKVHVSTLDSVIDDLDINNFSSPSLVVIGRVVLLHESFRWFEGGKTGSVFPAI